MTGSAEENGFMNSQDLMFSLHPDLLYFIESALNDESPSQVRELVEDLHTADIVEVINALDDEHRLKFIEAIKGDFSPDILVGLEGTAKEEVISYLGVKQSADVITQLETDDAIHVIEDLHEEDQAELLDEMSDEKRSELEEGLAYPEDSAGRLMNPNYVGMPSEWTVGQAIDFLRSEEDMPLDFHEVYVLNKKREPVGAVLTSRIVRMKREAKMVDIVSDNMKEIDAMMDQEEVAYIFQKYGLISAPVVNEKGKVVGALSLDDIIHVVEEEAEEDIMRLAGVRDRDMQSSAWSMAKYRSLWLFINLLTAIAASAVITLFEGEISQLVALAVIMPIVASMAGNAGTQTMTVTVRAISTREISPANIVSVTNKEVIAALLNGVLFAAIVALVSFLFYGNANLSLVFASAILLSLGLAALAGVLIPVMLDKYGADPAVSSGVFLTTVTDISAFFIFLGLAKFLLF